MSKRIAEIVGLRNLGGLMALAMLWAGGSAGGQTNCMAVTFQGAASASLKPSGNTHTVLLRQNDGSYTAFELTDASPYRIVRTTRNFQKQLTGCPGAPATGFHPSIQPPESFTRLRSGGWLWVRRSDVNAAPGSYFALNVVEFDSALNLVSEAQYPILIVAAFAVADVNGDGIPDILTGTAFPHSTGLQVLLGNGGSSFQAPVTYPISSSLNVQAVVVADLNGDGKPDAVLAAGGKISVFLGNGDGTFQPERTAFVDASSFAGIAIADLNRDSKPDLAYTTGPNSLAVALGVGDGTFGTPTKYAVGGGDSVAIGDVNGDGVADIVTSGFTILFGDGQGRFPNRADYWQGTDGNVILADFDGDGTIDIVSGMGNGAALAGPVVAVLFARGGGTFAGSPVSPVSGLPAPNNLIRKMASADFDGDGLPDLAVLELDQLNVLKGAGDGAFRATYHYTPAGGEPETIAIADFNRDGKPDIVAAINNFSNGSARIEVLLGKGDGTLQGPIAVAAPPGLRAIAVADLNGDGLPDVAAVAGTLASGSADQLLIYLGNGAGGLAAPNIYPTGPNAFSIAVGDFNGDGKPDLIVASGGTPTAATNSLGGNVAILFGKGDGTFSTPAPIPLGIDNPPAVGVVAADFDGDGRLDLAVTLHDQRLLILLGRGDGTFRTPVVYTISASTSGSYPLTVADLNGDGIPDLVSADSAKWMLGNGDGTFQPEVVFATAEAIAAADFTRDGKLDLAAGLFAGGVATLLNLSQPAPLTVVSAASFAAGPLAPNSLATAFGNFGSVATVTVNGSAATVLYTSPHQVNFAIPGLAPGAAAVTVAGSGSSVTAPIQLATVAPALFTLNSAGLAAAYVVRVRQGNQTIESVVNPIDFGPPGDQVYLSLFGTGIRGAGAAQVRIRIQGIDAPVTFAGAQPQFAGLDQVNVLLPRGLAGTFGDANIVLTAAGIDAPTVRVFVD